MILRHLKGSYSCSSKKMKWIVLLFLGMSTLWLIDFALAKWAQEIQEPDAEYITQRARDAEAEGLWGSRAHRRGCRIRENFWVYKSSTCFSGPSSADRNFMTLHFAKARPRRALLSRLIVNDGFYLERYIEGWKTYALIYEDHTWEIITQVPDAARNTNGLSGYVKTVVVEKGIW